MSDFETYLDRMVERAKKQIDPAAITKMVTEQTAIVENLKPLMVALHEKLGGYDTGKALKRIMRYNKLSVEQLLQIILEYEAGKKEELSYDERWLRMDAAAVALYEKNKSEINFTPYAQLLAEKKAKQAAQQAEWDAQEEANDEDEDEDEGDY